MEVTGCQVVTAGTGLLFEQSAVVAHTAWVARAMDATLSSGRSFALVTPSTTRITLGLSRVLEAAGATWVVSDEGTQHYDGLDGTALAWAGGCFRRGGELGKGFLDLPEQPVTGMAVLAQALHPPRPTTLVGGLAESLCVLATDEPPLGWGVLEPVGEPWSQADATSHLRDRGSGGGMLHVTGRRVRRGVPDEHFSASVGVRFTAAGVVEHVVGLWPEDGAWDEARVARFHQAMAGQGVDFAVLQQVHRAPGMLLAPHLQPPAVPRAAVMGPDTLRTRTVEAAAARAGAVARIVGRGRRRSLALDYHASSGVDPAEHYAGLVAWLSRS